MKSYRFRIAISISVVW